MDITKQNIEEKFELLENLTSPSDIKNYTDEKRELLCGQLRAKIIKTVKANGGHLASNLGVVELTVALHQIFDSPNDSIIFDVGHQCYAHKLLTGRYSKFHTLRTKDGVSGFPKPCESEHDAFIAGHSGTSISLAQGFAKAKKLSGSDNKVIAVIGDGSFTGSAFEALNNIDESYKNLIIVLNDNKMSISKNSTTIAQHLSKIRNKDSYFRFKDRLRTVLSAIPLVGKYLEHFAFGVKNVLKHFFYKNNLFEAFGLKYLGPVDGHDFEELSTTLQRAKTINRPVLVHVCTVKGKGDKLAEENPGDYHAVSKPSSSVAVKSQTFSEIAGDIIYDLGQRDDKIVAITAAMKYATGLDKFAKHCKSKNRFYDVGISEEHATIFSGALAKNRFKPVFCVYSSFLQRCYDQLLHDCSLDAVPVVIGVDRAGIVGEDGETHQGVYDVSFLTTLPNVNIYSPYNIATMKDAFDRAFYEETTLTAVRYPRGAVSEIELEDTTSFKDYSLIGKEKTATLLITYGRFVQRVYRINNRLEKTYQILALEKIFPLSDEVVELVSGFERIIFIEESYKMGSIGQILALKLLENGFSGKFIHKAIDNPVIKQATLEESIVSVGLDDESLLNLIR